MQRQVYPEHQVATCAAESEQSATRHEGRAAARTDACFYHIWSLVRHTSTRREKRKSAVGGEDAAQEGAAAETGGGLRFFLARLINSMIKAD